MSLSRFPLALGLALSAPFALAATPVGKWTGRISVTLPPMPANMPADRKAMMTKMLAQVAKARITLDVKADKTYTSTTSGAPMQTKPQKEAGKWSQKGSMVTFTELKAGARSQTVTLSADGRTMTMLLPQGQGKIVFTR